MNAFGMLRRGLTEFRSREARILFPGLALSLYGLYAAHFIWRTSFVIEQKRYFALFDDAMISMRYAWNLSHGIGLVWNAGERVEGFTNPLWVGLMSIATWLFDKSAACLAVQVLGAALLGWGAVMFSLTFRELDHVSSGAREQDGERASALWPTATLLLCLAPYPLLFWALMGMEVSLLTALLGSLFYLTAKTSKERDSRIMLAAGCVSALCYATRPDGVLLALPALAVLASRAKTDLRQHVRLFAPLALTIVAIGAFRYSYYGELIPNTYVLKMQGMPRALRLRNGFGFITPFLKEAGPLYAMAGLAVLVSLRGRVELALAAVPLLLLGYQVYVGGDPWPYWRMCAPGLPCLIVLLMLLFRAATANLARSSAARPAYLVSASAAILSMLWLNARFAPEYMSGQPFLVSANEANTRLAVTLTRVLRREAKIAVWFAGVVPYYTGFYAIDVLGKCDRDIARRAPDLSGSVAWDGMTSVPGHNKYDLKYSLITRAPDFVERTGWFSQQLDSADQALFSTVNVGTVALVLRSGSPQVRWSDLPAENTRALAAEPPGGS